MAEFPALPLFTDAYLADTRHLTTEEHGAYLLLLICAWRSRGCALKDSDKTLARIAGLSPTRWRRMKPALVDFFTVEGGLWRQKKLTAVHAGVAMRVARNKANGARGGRASSHASNLRRDRKQDAAPEQSPGESGSKTPAKAGAKTAATKTKSKTKPAAGLSDAINDVEPELDAVDVELWRSAAFTACGDDVRLNDRVLRAWHSAGVDMNADMIPTIASVKAREIARTGKPPRMLAYFREAVLEAMQARTLADAAAQKIADNRAQKIAFDPTDAGHWQQFLGDAGSRFRGDYTARHWFIDRAHPVFLPAELGPNPRLSYTNHIPPDIYRIYAPAWGWLPPCKATENPAEPA